MGAAACLGALQRLASSSACLHEPSRSHVSQRRPGDQHSGDESEHAEQGDDDHEVVALDGVHQFGLGLGFHGGLLERILLAENNYLWLINTTSPCLCQRKIKAPSCPRESCITSIFFTNLWGKDTRGAPPGKLAGGYGCLLMPAEDGQGMQQKLTGGERPTKV